MSSFRIYRSPVYLHLEETCRKMIRGSASPNTTNVWGDTPLHLACSIANYMCIEIILRLKPNLNIQNQIMCTPLNVFISKPPKNEVILKKLLEAGANPNIPDGDGYSPLHNLASQIETKKTKIFARLLVEYKANVNSQNNYKDTPLHIAIYEGKESLVEVLLESGASIDIPDVSGRTPMDKALLDRFRYPRILARLSIHLIILYCCGFSVNLEHLEEVCKNSRFSNFKRRCEEEIRKLKVTIVGNSTVTYHDILVSPIPVVSRYLFNTSILASFAEFDIGQSIFGPILKKKLEAASKHHQGLKKGIAAAEKIFPFLPYLCIDKLIEYLDIDDCNNLDEACSFRTQIL
ncbi:hypothetical protein WA026_019318 [Henosepilachna vigintioctopunctata]|uniref:Uncharacterized protein n=1 Tax=Henosepilachna vigintioctopunctata TaxID=420089 RepID=A0AAW1U996_9CUCU